MKQFETQPLVRGALRPRLRQLPGEVRGRGGGVRHPGLQLWPAGGAVWPQVLHHPAEAGEEHQEGHHGPGDTQRIDRDHTLYIEEEFYLRCKNVFNYES